MHFETTKTVNSIGFKIGIEREEASPGSCDSMGVPETPSNGASLEITEVCLEGSEINILNILDEDFVASLYKALEE